MLRKGKCKALAMAQNLDKILLLRMAENDLRGEVAC